MVIEASTANRGRRSRLLRYKATITALTVPTAVAAAVAISIHSRVAGSKVASQIIEVYNRSNKKSEQASPLSGGKIQKGDLHWRRCRAIDCGVRLQYPTTSCA